LWKVKRGFVEVKLLVFWWQWGGVRGREGTVPERFKGWGCGWGDLLRFHEIVPFRRMMIETQEFELFVIQRIERGQVSVEEIISQGGENESNQRSFQDTHWEDREKNQLLTIE
jgi:hypothetical protein